jgi:hypothetical protein
MCLEIFIVHSKLPNVFKMCGVVIRDERSWWIDTAFSLRIYFIHFVQRINKVLTKQYHMSIQVLCEEKYV